MEKLNANFEFELCTKIKNIKRF